MIYLQRKSEFGQKYRKVYNFDLEREECDWLLVFCAMKSDHKSVRKKYPVRVAALDNTEIGVIFSWWIFSETLPDLLGAGDVSVSTDNGVFTLLVQNG